MVWCLLCSSPGSCSKQSSQCQGGGASGAILTESSADCTSVCLTRWHYTYSHRGALHQSGVPRPAACLRLYLLLLLSGSPWAAPPVWQQSQPTSRQPRAPASQARPAMLHLCSQSSWSYCRCYCKAEQDQQQAAVQAAPAAVAAAEATARVSDRPSYRRFSSPSGQGCVQAVGDEQRRAAAAGVGRAAPADQGHAAVPGIRIAHCTHTAEDRHQ